MSLLTWREHKPTLSVFGWSIRSPGDEEAMRDEYHAAVITAEEGEELLTEFHHAFAGLADEDLEPCVDTCCGHLQERGMELYKQGLDAYYERVQANNQETP